MRRPRTVELSCKLEAFFFETADAVYLKEMLFKSVNGSYEHGTMEKHCLLACLLIVRGHSDDQIVLCRHVCVCVCLCIRYMYMLYSIEKVANVWGCARLV